MVRHGKPRDPHQAYLQPPLAKRQSRQSGQDSDWHSSQRAPGDHRTCTSTRTTPRRFRRRRYTDTGLALADMCHLSLPRCFSFRKCIRGASRTKPWDRGPDGLPDAPRSRLQALDPRELGQVTIECRERQLSRFPGNLEHETVGEAQRGALLELLERCRYDVGVLQGEVLMIEQHVDRGYDLLSRALVDRIEYPRGFRQDDVGNPGAACCEPLRGPDLLRVITHHDSHYDVRVNGAHGACG